MLLRRLDVVLFQDVAGALEKIVCCVLQDVAGAVPSLEGCDVPGLVAGCGTPFFIILGFNNPQSALYGAPFRKRSKLSFSIGNCKEKRYV